MDKSTRKTFDFKQYMDVFEKLDSNPNMTKYIVDLIRADMKNETGKIDKEEVFKIIEEYLQIRNIIVTDKPVEIIDEDKLKTSALKILNMKV